MHTESATTATEPTVAVPLAVALAALDECRNLGTHWALLDALPAVERQRHELAVTLRTQYRYHDDLVDVLDEDDGEDRYVAAVLADLRREYPDLGDDDWADAVCDLRRRFPQQANHTACAEALPCPRCDAAAGEPCRTPTGRTVCSPHAVRPQAF